MHISVAENRASIYGLFANIFGKEPTAEFLKLLKQEGKNLVESYKIDPVSDIMQFSSQKQVELLAVEYARLFVVPGAPAAARESLQRGEGRLWGDSTVEVNRIYKKFGFELDDSFKDTPDHLSAELAFLAQLSKLENEYASGKEQEAKKGVLEVKKHFLKDHLLKWFFSFKDNVTENAKLCYYKEFLVFLDTFLNEEWKTLKDVKDIST